LVQPDETPYSQFPIFTTLLSRIGELGELAGDVARFYSLAAAVRTTAIAAARGEYKQLTVRDRAELLKNELAMWQEIERLGNELVPKLRQTLISVRL